MAGDGRMAVRRVVTGNTDGRSCVISDDLTRTTWCDEIWMTDADHPDGVDPGSKMRPVEPPMGCTAFRIVSILPKAELLSVLANPDADTDDLLDSEGFHVTDTLDYVFVLDGPVELMLDVDSVVLEAGDCVIQRRTNHAWHNHNDHPVRLLSVMVR
jgi:mannose-6-phosphate isomerase-like protein (cupin superfamily)